MTFADTRGPEVLPGNGVCLWRGVLDVVHATEHLIYDQTKLALSQRQSHLFRYLHYCHDDTHHPHIRVDLDLDMVILGCTINKITAPHIIGHTMSLKRE